MGKFDKQPRSPGNINRERNQRSDPRESWCPCLEVSWIYLWLWGHLGIEELLSCRYTLRVLHKGGASGRMGLAGWVLSLQYPTSAEKVGHTRQVLCHNWYLGCMHTIFLDAPPPCLEITSLTFTINLFKRCYSGEMRPKRVAGLGSTSQAPPGLDQLLTRARWALD